MLQSLFSLGSQQRSWLIQPISLFLYLVNVKSLGRNSKVNYMHDAGFISFKAGIEFIFGKAFMMTKACYLFYAFV